MMGYIDEDVRISGLTLALLQDTGWYQVDWSKQEYFGWLVFAVEVYVIGEKTLVVLG